ncbi:MAG: alanine racemase [Actinobacteria bacterium]|nr:alanine racemase [Actinomycetota bacterium]
MTRQEELAANLAALERRIEAACLAAGRSRAGVTLVAVSKSWPATDVLLLQELGVHDFGENRDQEAAAKAAVVAMAGRASDTMPPWTEHPPATGQVMAATRWHFVGSVQTNKARGIAAYADVVHSLDRPSAVHALAAGARRAARSVHALVQVSLDGDPDRGGAIIEQVPALAELVAEADGLILAGVMAVAPRGLPALPAFERLVALAGRVRDDHPDARLISAGMTGDLEAAVQAGANVLRVGTALFGHRPPLLG